MSGMRTVLLLLFLLSSTGITVSAQSGGNATGNDGGSIPGEAQRRNRQEVAAAQARLPDPALQREALRLIESILQHGDERFVERNEAIVTSLLLPPRIAGSPRFERSFPHIRIEAAKLAARLDTPGSAAALTTTLAEDKDPAVQAAAARLLPSMDSVKPHEVAALLGRTLAAENRGDRHDSRLVSAIIEGGYTLYRRWGTEDSRLVRAILEVREGPYSRETRRMAGRFVELLLDG